MVGDVAPQPIQRDEEAGAQADQEIDVDEAPEQPADQPGQLEAAKLYHRRAAADCGEVTGVTVAELGRRRLSGQAPGDQPTDITAHLLRCRGDAGNLLAV